MLVLQPLVSTTSASGALRILGTMLGGIWVSLNWWWTPADPVRLLALFLPLELVFSYIFLFFPSLAYGGLVGMLTWAIIALDGWEFVLRGQEQSMADFAWFAGIRTINVSIGVVISLIAVWFFRGLCASVLFITFSNNIANSPTALSNQNPNPPVTPPPLAIPALLRRQRALPLPPPPRLDHTHCPHRSRRKLHPPQIQMPLPTPIPPLRTQISLRRTGPRGSFLGPLLRGDAPALPRPPGSNERDGRHARRRPNPAHARLGPRPPDAPRTPAPPELHQHAVWNNRGVFDAQGETARVLA